MALVGGALTLLFGMWHIARRQKDRLAIPYGVAISAAGLWILSTEYFPLTAQALGQTVAAG
jgi:prepilin peptidase CpaA